MASWKPRGPSPKIEERLFGARPASPRLFEAGWRLSLGRATGLAAACFLLMAALFLRLENPGQAATRAAARQAAFAALSNQSFTAYLTLDRARRNTWRHPLESPILRWTNDGPTPTKSGSWDYLNTNVLLPRL